MDFDDAVDRTEMENISPDSPEEEDDDSVHSSSSSDFSSDESDEPSPMDVGYGTPVLDEDKSTTGLSPGKHRTVHIIKENDGKSTERTGQDFSDNRSRRVSGTDDSAKTSVSKNQVKLHEPNSPRIEINIKNDKSFSRVSIDDHVELDFDESEDEDMKRDWRHEKRVTQNKGESEEEGAVDDDDDSETKNNMAVKITRQIGEEGKDEDCEEGEIKSSDEDTSSPDEDALDEIENPQYYEDRVMCRYFQWGTCHFGMSCRFLHPGVNDYGYDYGRPPAPQYQPPVSSRAPPQTSGNWGATPVAEKPPEKERSPSPEPAPPSPPTESAWERGLRHAKKMRELAKKRKEKETNFEEKRMNLSLEVDEEREAKEKARPKSVVKSKDKESLRITRELSDDKENIDTDKRVESREREPESYPEEPYTKQDSYYEKQSSYQDDYYEDRRGPEAHAEDENWGRNQQYDNYYARDWDNREAEYSTSQYRDQRYNKEYPPQRGKYDRGGGGYDYREPPYQRQRDTQGPPPPRDFSPEKEREYWDRRREEDYKKFNKSNALRENVREEEPVNRIRGEQWSDPWARVKEPPRRKGSRSRSRSRGRKGRRSYSNSSSSSFSSSSRSRSRSSSYSSSSYSSRSSYSSSSSRSRSRSRSRKSKEKSKQPVKLHARPPKSAAASAAATAKPMEGPPKSTVTKVSQSSEDKRPGPPASNRPARESERDRQGQPGSRGPPKGLHPGSRDRGASKGSGPPSRSGGPPPSRMSGPANPSRGGGPPPGRSTGPPGSRLGGPPSSSRSGDHLLSSRSSGPSGRGSAPGKPGSGPSSSRDPPPSQSKGPLHQRIEKTASTSQGGSTQSKTIRDSRPPPATGQKGQEEPTQRSRKDQSQRTVSPRGASSDKRERDSRQLPGRMKTKPTRTYSSSSSSKSRSRSYSRSFSRSRSRSSRGSSASSSSSSSSASSYSSSGSADSEHMYRGIKSGKDDRSGDTRKDSGHRKMEVERGTKRHGAEPMTGKDRSGSQQYSNPPRRDRQPRPGEKRDFNRDRRPPVQEHQSQGRPPAERYSRSSQRDARDDRRGGDRGGSDKPSYRSSRPADQTGRDQDKSDSQKSGIKLTLKSNDKVTRPTKRNVSNGGSDVPPKKGRVEDNQDRSGRRSGKPESSEKGDGPSSAASKSASPGEQPKKKSTSSRREELLKQLKAVENAISRKRSKMS